MTDFVESQKRVNDDIDTNNSTSFFVCFYSFLLNKAQEFNIRDWCEVEVICEEQVEIGRGMLGRTSSFQ